MPTILMVDYVFPPMAGPGSARTLGYANHLSEIGWSPIVLTVAGGVHAYYDLSLTSAVLPTVEVHRTRQLDPVGFLKKVFARVSRQRLRGVKLGGCDVTTSWRPVRGARNLERWVFFPDRYIGWLPFGVVRALRIARARPLDIIHSTSTVITSHLIAYLVKRIVNKPWVADFQDPIAENPVHPFPSRLHRHMAASLERLIVRNADRVVITTNAHRDVLLSRYPLDIADKFVVIPIGFDAQAFESVEPVASDKFVVTHFGTFYSSRSPAPFLNALARCVAEHSEFGRDVQVLLFGTFEPEMLALARFLIDHHHLHEKVHFRGVVPYREAVGFLKGSSVLLLISGKGEWGRYMSSAKLAEYLAARRPILALAPEGAIAETVRDAGAGWVLEPDDVSGIKEALLRAYHRWKDGSLTTAGDLEYVARFRLQEVTANLARILREVLDGEAPLRRVVEGP